MSTLPPTTDTGADPEAWTSAHAAADRVRQLLAHLGADADLVRSVAVWHNLSRSRVCVHLPALPPEVAHALADLGKGARP